ncbi:hypothetical protein Tco_0643005, partial [Tanacetum coccineum]
MAKQKDAPSSVLTRSGRKTSTGIQASTKEIAEEGSRDSNGGSKKRKRYDAGEFKSRKFPRFQKQMGPTTKPEKSEKIGSTPLRRSESGKNPVAVPASNVKSIEKSVVTEEGSRDSNGGCKK